MGTSDVNVESVLVIGAGTIGFTKGAALQTLGHRVRFVDTSSARCEDVRRMGTFCDQDYELSDASQIIFICVPTPASEFGYDLSHLRGALEILAEKLKTAGGKNLIAICSTVPPGTTTALVVPVLETASGLKEGERFDVAVIPEFVRESRARDDALNPWITVIAGASDVARSRLVALLSPFGGEIRTFTNPIVAELIKVTHNAFNATKISFFNELYQFATFLGVDGHVVAEVVSKSAEGSFNPSYGIRGGAPFSGRCLPKDLDGLIAFAAELSISVPMLEATRSVNQSFTSK